MTRIQASLIVLLAAAFSAGCRSLSPPPLPLAPYSLDRDPAAVVTVDCSETSAIPLTDAILHALDTDPAINELAIRCHRAAGDLAAIHPDSPEVRAEYAESRDSRRGWSTQREWGSSIRRGEQLSSSTGSQTTEQRQVSKTDYGDPWDPEQTAVEKTTGAESSRSSEYETSLARSSSSETSSDADYQRQQEDGVSLELRIKPPNPWQLMARRQAAGAARTIAETELLLRERELACDTIESGLRLLYHGRMLSMQSAFGERASRVRTELLEAFESGAITVNDYADGCRLAANALAKQHRMESELADLKRDLRFLTGLEPGRIELDGLKSALLTPFPIPEDPTNDIALARSLSDKHAVVLVAEWNLHRSRAEWKEARSANIPWATHLAAGYAWWDGSRTGYGTFESSGSKTELAQSVADENQTETGYSSSTEKESPSGDVTERKETTEQTSTSRTSATETEEQTSQSSGTESSYAEDNGREWWVEVGIEIPVFEWLSGESRIRRKAVANANLAHGRVSRRVRSEIVSALRAVRRNREDLIEARRRFEAEIPVQKKLAATARTQGLAGELEALRVEEGIVEMVMLLLDCSLRDSLTRLDLVRAAGCMPDLSE